MSASLSSGMRGALYLALLLTFAAIVGIGAAMSGQPNPRFAYLILLFALCSSPLLLVEKINGPRSILMVLGPMLFLYYGALDLANIWAPERVAAATGLLSQVEAALLAAMLLLFLGHLLGSRLGQRAQSNEAPRDWAASAGLVVGLLLWGAGAFASYVWQVEVLNRAFTDIEGRIGIGQAMLVTAARTLQPLGLLLVAYRAVVGRNAVVAALLVGMLAVEFLVGFVGDSKELAMRGLALVFVTSLLLRGKVPRTWLVLAGVIVVTAFPVFQAYRTEVLSGGRDRGKAAENLRANLDKALDSRLLDRGEDLYGWRSFVERASHKPTMERIVRDVGVAAEFQRGHTLGLYFAGLIPRALWPEKPDVSTGQLFNRELRISAFRDVYISVTHLGELYWNFGWTGLFTGAALIGMLLGVVNARCDLSRDRSVSRLLVLTVTIYLVVVRMEDNLAMTYLVWTRSLLAILVLHWLFARRSTRPASPPVPATRAWLSPRATEPM